MWSFRVFRRIGRSREKNILVILKPWMGGHHGPPGPNTENFPAVPGAYPCGKY